MKGGKVKENKRGAGGTDTHTHHAETEMDFAGMTLLSWASQTHPRPRARQRPDYQRVKLHDYRISPPWGLWKSLPGTSGGNPSLCLSFSPVDVISCLLRGAPPAGCGGVRRGRRASRGARRGAVCWGVARPQVSPERRGPGGGEGSPKPELKATSSEARARCAGADKLVGAGGGLPAGPPPHDPRRHGASAPLPPSSPAPGPPRTVSGSGEQAVPPRAARPRARAASKLLAKLLPLGRPGPPPPSPVWKYVTTVKHSPQR